ncbi:MAG: hypothetical protein EOP39_12255 [Rubrivivax sp.]|nr:MAG: hypothetical protein EOP39_12255 [Rubrivivax sp.]
MTGVTRPLRVGLMYLTLGLVAACGGGGGGDAGSGSVPATPTAAASGPLQLGALGWPAELTYPRHIALIASGGDGKLSWSVECGPGLGCAVVNGMLEMESRAEGALARVPVTATVTDGTGARASVSTVISVWPKIMTSGLHTLAGATDRPGPQLLIITDGYPEDDAGFVLDTASAIVDSMFGHPEIAAHRSAWNIHVAHVPSPVSAEGGLAGSSRFGMNSCPTSSSLLACVQPWTVRQFAALYLPNYTDVLVLANDSLHPDGLTKEGIAVVSRFRDTVTSAVHELGHSFAGLGDEYVLPGGRLPNVLPPPPDQPNITRATDLEHIPWKHWIEPGTPLPTQLSDPVTVGLYEGAYTMPAGYFRPTASSFMRVSAGNGQVGPVNGEAWALQVYAKGGAWRRMSPATGSPLDRLAQPADGWRFVAEPLMDRTICETRWYVNGVERAEQRGAVELRLSDAGALEVRVDLVDLTGRIRKNRGVASSLTWTVR